MRANSFIWVASQGPLVTARVMAVRSAALADVSERKRLHHDAKSCGMISSRRNPALSWLATKSVTSASSLAMSGAACVAIALALPIVINREDDCIRCGQLASRLRASLSQKSKRTYEYIYIYICEVSDPWHKVRISVRHCAIVFDEFEHNWRRVDC